MTPKTTCTEPDCPATRHHTMSAYSYGCKSPAAREDHRLYYKRRRQGRPYRRRIDPTGTRHRIQALYALGHTSRTIATVAGLNPQVIQRLTHTHHTIHTTTATAINHAYNTLRDTPGTNTRTQRWAQRNGWLTPTDWDTWGPGHIDTPDPADETIDEEAISRVVTKHAPLDILTPAEQAALYTRLHGQGITDGSIRHRLNLSAAQINRMARYAQKGTSWTTTSPAEPTTAASTTGPSPTCSKTSAAAPCSTTHPRPSPT